MRRILQYILKILAKIVLWQHKPVIVAITGSVGKTSTKEAVYYVLKKQFRVRRNMRNYNNEIGVPLTILGLETGGCSVVAWLKNFFKAGLMILWGKDYPEILVLEMGVDRPGDVKYLVDFVPIKVGIITAIGQFPSHIEFFPEKGKLVEEKALLVKSLVKDGLAVLDYDDLSVRMIGDDLPQQTKTVYYGFGQGADLRIMNYELSIKDLEKNDFGVTFKLEYQGSIVPVKLNRALGKQQVYAATAAAAVGLYFGLNLVEISAALRKYRSLPGRTKLLKGIKGSWLIDDSYNASPLATIAALEILERFWSAVLSNSSEAIEESRSYFPASLTSSHPSSASSGRKIAVLGDMLELGADTEAGHRQVGQKAASVVDLLFTVGSRARFIADEARQQGLAKERIFEFSQAEEAALAVQEKLAQGDIVLVKGSRAMHLEKVVKEIMAYPEKADKLLVR
jgi:UDP-N-acetylmuramoyl-tripeptide--D-alanyl-D-alanine ligase